MNVLTSVVPLFLLMLLGCALKRYRFPGDGFWKPAETLTYYLLFPALLVQDLSQANFREAQIGPMLAALIGATLIVSALMLLTRKNLHSDGPAFTSVFQGAVRFNSYVGLGTTALLYGKNGLALAAVAVGGLIIVTNILSIFVLARYAGERRADWKAVSVSIARNPLIVSSAIGISLNLLGLGVPWGLDRLLGILAGGALGLALLCVGAGLDVTTVRASQREVFTAIFAKLMLLPLITLILCKALGVQGLAFEVALLFAALPPAANSYILATQLGGDARLMASIITSATLATVVSIPLWLVTVG
jgi:malonate transporter and related proteins